MAFRVVCGAVLTASLAAAPAARAEAQGEEEDLGTARVLFVEGSRLAGEGHWVEARDRYERSLALKRASLTLYSLAVAQRNTGKLVLALENFRAFVAEPVPPAGKPYEQPARDAIAELERRVARIDLWIEPPDARTATVWIDDATVPRDSYGQPRVVDPGAHSVQASLPGYRSARAFVTLGEGERRTVRLVLEPLPLGEAVSLGMRERALPLALLGAGAGAFGAGVTLAVVGANDASRTWDGESQKEARAMELGGGILAGVGLGVAAAGGIVLATRAPSGSGTTITVRAWMSPSGIGVSGTF